MLPRIKHLPAGCKEFFRRFQRTLEPAHFAHCWRTVLLVAVLHGRRSLSGFTAATAGRRTRQAISHFLEEDLWDGVSLLRQKALDTLRKLGWRTGDTVYVALDDTQQRKRGKKMDAVKKLFLHAEKVYAPAHIFVTCVLIYRGVVIPYAVRLWLPKEFSRRVGDRAWVTLVTNRRNWSAKTVLSHYQQRWGIEVLFKMAKQHLGLGDYQFLRYRAIENYLRLVLLAYLLLTHQALRASDVQAELKKRQHVLRLASISQHQQRLRAAVWDDLVLRLENRPKQRIVARKIKELLQNCG